MSSTTWVAGSLLAAYFLFLWWYGGRGAALTPVEIELALNELRAEQQQPDQQRVLDELRTLLANDDGREFVMHNLVRYRERALYPAGHSYGDDPRAADRRYGRAILWPLLRRACLPVFIARRAGRFIEPANMPAWHYVASVRYRSRRDFLSFAQEIARADIVMHKWAAIATTQVFPVQPLISLVFVRGAVAVLLTLLGWLVLVI